jgi:hypothetical protein
MGLGSDASGGDRRVDSVEARDLRKLKAFVLRKGGHTFCFCYPARFEKSAIKAARDCDKLEAIDVVALACYLGHDPKEFGL